MKDALNCFLLSIFLLLTTTSYSQRLVGEFELGYPKILDHYNGIFFFGYSYCFYYRPSHCFLVKTEPSLYNLRKKQVVINQEFVLVGEYNLMGNASRKHVRDVILIGEAGYNTIYNRSIVNDHGLVYTAGIEYLNRAVGSGRLFVHYQWQNHSGHYKESNQPIQDFGIIKIGLKAVLWYSDKN